MDRSVLFFWIAPPFGSIRRCLNRPIVWIALSFGSLRFLDRSVVWIALSFGLLRCAPSVASLRRLDRSVMWIALSFGSFPDDDVPSFGSLRRLDRTRLAAPLILSSPSLQFSTGITTVYVLM